MDIKFSTNEKKFINYGKIYGLDFLNINIKVTMALYLYRLLIKNINECWCNPDFKTSPDSVNIVGNARFDDVYINMGNWLGEYCNVWSMRASE